MFRLRLTFFSYFVYNKNQTKCKFHDMDQKKDYRNYEVSEILNKDHADIVGCGRESLIKATEKSKFSCHWELLLVLTGIFKSLNTELTGEMEKPWDTKTCIKSGT